MSIMMELKDIIIKSNLDIKKLISEQITEIGRYDENDIDEAYQKGLQEGWGLAVQLILRWDDMTEEKKKKIGDESVVYGLRNAFPRVASADVAICQYNVNDAKKFISNYEQIKTEETDDLEVGDEVTFITIGGELVNGVVTGQYGNSREFRVMNPYGNERYCCKAKKTGRYFPQIKETLEQMRSDA